MAKGPCFFISGMLNARAALLNQTRTPGQGALAVLRMT